MTGGKIMNIAYVRVSTVDQNEDRQIEAIKQEVDHIDKWFIEKVSGKNTEREKFKQMMNFIREGDEVYVHDWSRLSRSTKDLLSTIEELNNKGVKLVSLKESFDTSTPTGKLMLGLISSINQYEREILLERQREGIAVAKKKGVYKGRKQKEFETSTLLEVLNGIRNKEMTVKAGAEALGVTRQTVYNLLKRNK